MSKIFAVVAAITLALSACSKPMAGQDAAAAAAPDADAFQAAADTNATGDALLDLPAAASDAVAAAGDATGIDAAGPSLYVKLGKKAGIALFVDTFFSEASISPILALYVPKDAAKLKGFKAHMTDALAIIWGCTDCAYAGSMDMAAVHKGVMVAEAEWNAFTGLAFEVMNEELLIPNETIIAAVSVLETYKAQIVDKTSLYSRFGGRAKAFYVCAELLNVLVDKDPLLAPRFAGIQDRLPLINKMADFIAGPLLGQKFAAYAGKPLPAAHAGMKISAAELKAMMALFAEAMTKYNVGASEKAEVLALIDQAAQGLIGQ